MEGDFKDICLFIIHKISPNPSFPKRGIMRLDQKTIYKQTLFMRQYGILSTRIIQALALV
jgi:hypothetical protein